MSREDLHIDVDGDRLSVWGDKRVDSEADDGDYHLVQCACGSFRRELVLPNVVDADRAKATYRDDVLRIEIPRLERRRGHRVLVQGDRGRWPCPRCAASRQRGRRHRESASRVGIASLR